MNLFDKFKAFATRKLVGTAKSLGPWRKREYNSNIVGIVALILAYCLYIGEQNVEEHDNLFDHDELREYTKIVKIRRDEDWICEGFEEKKVGCVEWGSGVLNKVWPCVTLALASYFYHLGSAHFT